MVDSKHFKETLSSKIALKLLIDNIYFKQNNENDCMSMINFS